MILLKDIPIRDPFVLCEGEKYYLYSSGEKNGEPCFICYRSDDLHIFSEPILIFEKNDGFWGTKNYWAPEVHKYKGRYYLFASCKADDLCRGTSIFVSDTPDGMFKPLINRAVTPLDWECLDGTLYVDNGIPYIIFCREWLQVKNGEIYVAELSDDLISLKSEPRLLFSAKDAPWVSPIEGEDNYVTDGPFIIKENNEYRMIWSSFSKNGYAIGLARSKSLTSGWINENDPIYDNDGGHGMIFEKDGEKMIIFHSPNCPSGQERAKMLPLRELIH